MLDTRHDLSLCCAVGPQLVCDHHSGWPSLALQELAHPSLGGFCISAALHENVQRETVLVTCAPQPMFLAPGLKQRLRRDATCPQADRMIDDGSRWQRCGRIS